MLNGLIGVSEIIFILVPVLFVYLAHRIFRIIKNR